MLKTLKGYWIEILVGAVLVAIDFRLFVFFFFVVYLISSEKRIDYLRKLIRIFHIANEVKIVSIMRKLEIDPSKAEQVFNEMENNMTDRTFSELEKDFASVTNLNNLKD